MWCVILGSIWSQHLFKITPMFVTDLDAYFKCADVFIDPLLPTFFKKFSILHKAAFASWLIQNPL